jgi:predicted MFS family arabinose efflux permease
MAFYAATTYLGQLLGNLGGGMLLERIDIFAFFKILALACMISAVLIIVLKYAERQAASRSSKQSNLDSQKEVS